MADHMSTAWVRMYCSTDRKPRVATFRRVGEEWQLVAVGGAAQSVGATVGGLAVSGSFAIGPGYAGCPGCRSDSYVLCSVCGQLVCWRNTAGFYTCGAAARGAVSGAIGSLGAIDVD